MDDTRGKKRDKHRYVKLRPKEGGPWCVCEPVEVESMMDGEPAENFETQEVWMTRAEAEALSEFEGW